MKELGALPKDCHTFLSVWHHENRHGLVCFQRPLNGWTILFSMAWEDKDRLAGIKKAIEYAEKYAMQVVIMKQAGAEIPEECVKDARCFHGYINFPFYWTKDPLIEMAATAAAVAIKTKFSDHSFTYSVK